MHLLVIFGCLGIGAVWGWLAGRFYGLGLRPLFNSLSLSTATAVLGSGIAILADWRAALVFLAAAAFSVIAHILWRKSLMAHTGYHQPG